MAKRMRRMSKKAGLKPGSVVYVGKERTEDVHIDIIDYTDSEYSEKRVSTVEECFPYKEGSTLTWINVDGLDTHFPQPILNFLGNELRSVVTTDVFRYTSLSHHFRQCVQHIVTT